MSRTISELSRSIIGVALLMGLSGLTAACGGAGDRDQHQAHVLEPAQESVYMEKATQGWNWSRTHGRRYFDPVSRHGRRFDGDPRTYERVCGARFLVHGRFPAFGATPDGTSPAGSGDQTYYGWLQADSRRWSAFNAWLSDPAVERVVAPQVELLLGTHMLPHDLTQIGDTSHCPNV